MPLPTDIAGLILANTETVEFTATGETDAKGRTLFRKDMLRVGSYTHPTRGWTLDVDISYLNGLAKNFNEMKILGIEVPVTQDHSKKAKDACGELVGCSVSGNTLYGIHAIDPGEVALTSKSGIGTSVEINRDYVTTGRRRLGAALTANSIVQHPVVPGQGDFVKIAASIGDESSVDIDAPVLILSQSTTTNPAEEFDMKDLIKLLNQNFSLSIDAEADDEAVAKAVQAHVEASLAEKDEAHGKIVTAKDNEITTLTASLAEAKPVTMVPTMKALSTDSLKTRLTTLRGSSKLSKEASEALEASLTTDLMLSVAEGAERPGYAKILDAIELNDPVKLGEQTANQAMEMSRETPDGDDKPEEVSKRRKGLVSEFGGKAPESKED